jgi:predicted alpha/beta-hydrolase family hydrolase
VLNIPVDAARTVSGLLSVPDGASAGFVMAHGAGAGMNHPFMAAVANGLHRRGIATLRYQFPYMEAGSKRPDRPALAHVTVRAAVATAVREVPGMTLVAGGKSFGGRMTSQAQAEAPLPYVAGVVFLGFPLHPAKRPSTDRAQHLTDVRIPMLFLQGTRDALAEQGPLLATLERLGKRATLYPIDDADHAFHVPARSGRADSEVLEGMLDTLAAWIDLHTGATNDS